MSSLSRIETWRDRLGLLPVEMEVGSSNHVLLNGDRGNFCLNRKRVPEDWDHARSEAWSCNVGQYVALKGSDVLVQRWDRSRPELFRRSEVEGQLDTFHAFLEKNAPATSEGIVAHCLQTFRTLRSILGPNVTGPEALRVFLVLLASAAEGAGLEELDVEGCQLDPEAVAKAESLGEVVWGELRSALIGGRPVDKLTPDVCLLLRHASGLLFQEAHYAALHDQSGQLYFGGFLPPPLVIAKPALDLGVHFTPPAIARSIVEEAVRNCDLEIDKLSVLDPACGSGEFLRETLRQLRMRGFNGKVSLVGMDISSAAVDMARFSLQWEVRSTRDAAVTFKILHVDALSQEWPRADVVLMNPPFLSWESMGSNQRATVKAILRDYYSKRADMALAFVWKAIQCANGGGIVGTVVPSVFFSGASYEALREAFSEVTALQVLAKFGSHSIFYDAKVDAGFLVSVKERDRSEHGGPVMIWADHRSRSTYLALRELRKLRNATMGTVLPKVEEGFCLYEGNEVGHLNDWSPRPYPERQLLRSLEKAKRVRDFFSVRQGTLTGSNRVFVLSREEFGMLPEVEHKYFRRATVNESISSGRIDNWVHLFYPHGARHLDSEEDVRAAVPTFYKSHLKPNRNVLLSRARVDPKKWWTLSEHRRWQEEDRVKVISKYFGDRGSFAWDEKGDLVALQGYAWLSRKKRVGRSYWLACLAILNSETMWKLIMAKSSHLGGGQWNLSKRYMEGLPFPELAGIHIDVDVFSQLHSIGSRIHSEGLSSVSNDDMELLEALIREAFRSSSTL